MLIHNYSIVLLCYLLYYCLFLGVWEWLDRWMIFGNIYICILICIYFLMLFHIPLNNINNHHKRLYKTQNSNHPHSSYTNTQYTLYLNYIEMMFALFPFRKDLFFLCFFLLLLLYIYTFNASFLWLLGIQESYFPFRFYFWPLVV